MNFSFHVCTWTQAEQGFYFIGKDLSVFLKQKFEQLIGQEKAGPQEVEVVMGRTLQVFAKLNIHNVIHNTCSYVKKPDSLLLMQ